MDESTESSESTQSRAIHQAVTPPTSSRGILASRPSGSSSLLAAGLLRSDHLLVSVLGRGRLLYAPCRS